MTNLKVDPDEMLQVSVIRNAAEPWREDLRMDDTTKKILDNQKRGVVTLLVFEDMLAEIELSEFVKQPAEGILYDLNRLPEVALTHAKKDPKWINDFAVAMVIGYLKTDRDALAAENERLLSLLREALPWLSEYSDEIIPYDGETDSRLISLNTLKAEIGAALDENGDVSDA